MTVSTVSPSRTVGESSHCHCATSTWECFLPPVPGRRACLHSVFVREKCVGIQWQLVMVFLIELWDAHVVLGLGHGVLVTFWGLRAVQFREKSLNKSSGLCLNTSPDPCLKTHPQTSASTHPQIPVSPLASDYRKRSPDPCPNTSLPTIPASLILVPQHLPRSLSLRCLATSRSRLLQPR